MAGRRPLSRLEERQLLRVVRKLRPRDRALITAAWLTGFRIHEVLALTVGHVLRGGELVSKIGISPRHLKGHYGKTRWVPVLPELERALRHHLWWLRLKYELTSDLPLFPSRETDGEGGVRPISRVQAHRLLKRIFARAGVADDGRLGWHSFRKGWAAKIYLSSGHDLLLVKSALGHRDVNTSQRYLEVEEDRVMAAIAKCDFTRRPRKKVAEVVPAQTVPAPATPSVAAA